MPDYPQPALLPLELLVQNGHRECVDLNPRIAFSDTFGTFTPPMAAALGLSRTSVRRKLKAGQWVRICGDAIVMSEDHDSALHRAVGAVLTWPRAIVCLRTAAFLQGLPIEDDGIAHVLMPDTRRPRFNLKPHFYRHGRHFQRLHGVRMTDLHTTIIDCLAQLPEEEAWSLPPGCERANSFNPMN